MSINNQSMTSETTVTMLTTSTEAAPQFVEDAEIQAINGFRIFICAIGIPANLIVILAVLFHTKFRKRITAWYIVQLAIADTAFLITLPFEVVEDQWNSWIFPEWMCKAKEAVRFINYYASVTFLTLMAIDRYIAICHTFSERLQKLRTHSAVYIITAVVWTVCVAISLHVGFFSQVRGMKPYCRCQLVFPEPPKTPTQKCIEQGFESGELLELCLGIFEPDDSEEGHCTTNNLVSSSGSGDLEIPTGSGETLQVGCHYLGYSDGFRGFLSFNFGVMFVVPFLVIAVCYVLIIRHLGTATTKRVKAASKTDKGRKKVVAMCVALVVVFTVCWFPYHGVHLAKMNGIPGTSDYCIKLLHATSLLVYLNSAINPFIYFILIRSKSEIKRLRKSSFGSFFTKGRSSAPSQTASNNSTSDRTNNTGITNSKVRESTGL